MGILQVFKIEISKVQDFGNFELSPMKQPYNILYTKYVWMVFIIEGAFIRVKMVVG